MKRFLLACIAIVCFFPLVARYVENQPYEHIQPDGTKLSLFVTGDEYFRRVHDARGYTILLHPDTGYAVYALPDGNDIQASNHVAGLSDPAALGINPGLHKDPEPARQMALDRQANRDAGNRGSPVGTLNNIVGFVRFSDQTEFPSTTTYTWYNNLFNSTSQQSMKDYYTEVSSGQLTVNTNLYPGPSGTLVVSMQVSHTRNYYRPYNATTNPTGYTEAQMEGRLLALTQEVIGMIDPYVPGTINLDNDGDGIVDALTFIFRGGVDVWGEILWPTHWSWSGVIDTLNGVDVTHYVFDFEGGLGASVICHEMGHMMGFPDFYHYTSNGITPVGSWCLMASDNTQHSLTYNKWKYGTWFSSIPTITPTSTPTTYTLTAIDQSPYSCYKIASSNPNQFYVLEYRRKTGRYETGVPASGLIVYRIISSYGGSAVNGNAGGPPDEVYVYRPGGDIDTNGTINSANFSSTVNRTEIHNFADPQPWLYVNTTTQSDGNLVITDVGASGGTTITFTVRNAAPNIWDGSTSTAWDTASNWSQNSVPTNAQYVEIPSGLTRYPVVSTVTPICKHLTVKNGATITITSGSLTVETDALIYGALAMTTSTAGNFYVQRDLIFGSGATTNITVASEIYVGRHIEFLEGSNVNLANGYLEMSGTGNCFVRTYAPATINHFRSNKSSGGYASFSNVSTATLTINGSLWTYSGSRTYHAYAGTTILKGSLFSYTGGLVTFYAGTISFEGTASSSIFFEDTGNNLRNVTVNKTGTSVFLSSAVEMTGNLIIQSGTFNPSSNTLTLGGNWTNNVGPTAFTEGTGTVILNGSGTQTMTTENFYTLVLNKSGGIMSIPTGVTVTCQSYDWTAGAYTVSGGTFTVADLVDAGILGTITLSSGTINYTQDSSNYIDLRANLTISGGVFNVYGGNSTCWFSYIDEATLTMTNGTLDIRNYGILIPSNPVFHDNISGGTIKTVGSFTCNRADFNPSGGTIEMYGSIDGTLSHTAGSNLANVTINKAAARDEGGRSQADYYIDRLGNQIPITRSNTITASGDLDINGILTIQAGTFNAPTNLYISGNLVNTAGVAAFAAGTGTVIFDGSGHQYCNFNTNFNNLTINKSGGALRVNNSSAIVTCASYNWTAGAVDVIVGTFTALDLLQNGIYGNFYVNPGGTINLTQDSSSWNDLNGFLYNYGGTINIYGGNMSCYLAYAANAGITMTNGNIYFRDRGISIYPSAHDLTMNVTGGFIRTVGQFYDGRGGVIFAGGTVDLYGPGATTVTLGTGSRFNNLSTNKSGGTRAETETGIRIVGSEGRFETVDMRDNSVTANSNIQINGSLIIDAGIFDVNGNTITVYNDLAVWGTLKMISAGTLDVGDDVLWQPSGVSNVSAGTIYCGGNWTFTSSCTVDLTGSTARLDAFYGATLTNNSPTAKFGSLQIYGTEEDPEFTYNYSSAANHLLVAGDLIVYGTNLLNLNEGICTVSGYAQINETGAILVGDGGTFTVNGDFILYGSLVTGPGTAIVHGNFTNNASSSLIVAGGSFINDAPWATPYVVNLYGAVNINSGVLEITHRTLTINSHATRVFNNATLRVGMGFIASAANCYLPSAGALYMIGTGSPVLTVPSPNFISNLYIQKSALANTAYLQNPTLVTGNLSLVSGKLNTNNHNLTVGGNWTSTAGAADFAAGTGTVFFNKSGGTQTISGPVNFYNVMDNHTGSALDFQGPTGISGTLTVNAIVTFQNTASLGTVSNIPVAAILAFYGAHTSTIASYTGGGALRSFSGSHVNIADLTQDGLYGAYVADNGHLEIHQDSANWIDVNGPVTITNNGIIDIYGGSLSCYFAYNGNVVFTMSSGSFNVKDRGITSYPRPYTVTYNITGGTISLNGNFYDYRNSFNPSGGTVLFEGSMDAYAATTAPG
ncbi:MAG: M6 family metalloprotease domain-containing protein [Candidatus Cloacimonadaceae bacterium]|nr:M6 family metalloprotease domain-containing protein [Candidatus Cloacimonadaceae bacterium]